MQPGGFPGHSQVVINLMEVAANAHQHFPRTERGEVTVLDRVIAEDEVLDAIRLGPEFAMVEDVDVIFLGRGLKPADEMSGQADSRPRE